jgi:hypothetical protein
MKIYNRALTIERIKNQYLHQKTNAMLHSLVGSQQAVDVWWNSQNLGLQMSKPCDCESEAVYNYVLSYYERMNT